MNSYHLFCMITPSKVQSLVPLTNFYRLFCSKPQIYNDFTNYMYYYLILADHYKPLCSALMHQLCRQLVALFPSILGLLEYCLLCIIILLTQHMHVSFDIRALEAPYLKNIVYRHYCNTRKDEQQHVHRCTGKIIFQQWCCQCFNIVIATTHKKCQQPATRNKIVVLEGCCGVSQFLLSQFPCFYHSNALCLLITIHMVLTTDKIANAARKDEC